VRDRLVRRRPRRIEVIQRHVSPEPLTTPRQAIPHRTAGRCPATLLDEDWRPRTTLLSPFDNLICDRDRTERLWGFAYRNEIYVPKQKRRFGSYVLPVLAGERLIGRVAPRMDRFSPLHQAGGGRRILSTGESAGRSRRAQAR
jgi:uncharacterized protein YcaQ